MWSSLILLPILVTALDTAIAHSQNRPRPGRGRGSNWWGIAKAGEPNNLLPLVPGAISYMGDPVTQSTLRRKQRRLVRENPGVLVAVSKGANMAIQECQFQFKNRRWNCSTRNFFRGKNLFGKIVDRAILLLLTSANTTTTINFPTTTTTTNTITTKITTTTTSITTSTTNITTPTTTTATTAITTTITTTTTNNNTTATVHKYLALWTSITHVPIIVLP
ncbi:unnamed protein product [Nesidiocoris tenuis]|uniref:Protein Wnt n=1 Tax=Nesidiocoris tenuis TaxID=355587 RepID=A0A6H5GAH5_9HEMI|nr:unnamed protein product [Nesidiocoris tenuis]